jgi:Peptidase_C39 like family
VLAKIAFYDILKQMELPKQIYTPERAKRVIPYKAILLGLATSLSAAFGSLESQPIQQQEAKQAIKQELVLDTLQTIDLLRTSSFDATETFKQVYEYQRGIHREVIDDIEYKVLSGVPYISQIDQDDPKFPDNQNLCGPASLAMIVAWKRIHDGLTTTKSQVEKMIYSDTALADIPEQDKDIKDPPQITGGIASVVMDTQKSAFGPLMRKFLDTQGIESEFGGKYSYSEVTKELELGHPVLLNLTRQYLKDGKNINFDHFVVVIGFDSESHNLVVQDPWNNLLAEDWATQKDGGGKKVIYPGNGIEGVLDYNTFTKITDVK